MADFIKKKTVRTFRKMKENGEKIVMITAYDATTAMFSEHAGVDMILVGDSLAMSSLGYTETIPMTMDAMVHHSAAVRRGAPNTFIVGDMPFLVCHLGVQEGLKCAGRFIQEANCDAVKLECTPSTLPLVKAMVEAGIPVMGHLGLLPQGVKTSGGYRINGRTREEADELEKRALELEEAGVFSIVFECVPAVVAEAISKKLSVPTIGIGAGAGCDGQVQVICDLLGYTDGFLPKHAKRFAEIGKIATSAIEQYKNDVKDNAFPTSEQSF